jgi:limonene-1,2-epoxide hydrolase
MRRSWTALALGAALIGGMTMATSGALAAETAKADPRVAVVREMAAAWNARDWDKVVGMFAEDGVLHSMMLEPIVGRKSIDVRIKQLGAGISDITLDLKNVAVTGDTVFIERVDRFTYNGHKGEVPVVGVIEVKNGKVQAWREYYDRKELLTAMGLVQDFDKEAR